MLQCQLCSKPFTNPSSHTRHLRYCLKARNRPRVRQKSCVACSASKVKCTFQRPSCAKCHRKGTECMYDNEARPTPEQPKTPSMTTVEPTHVEFQPWGQEISETNQLIDWNAIDLFLPDDFSTPTIVDLDFPVQPEVVTGTTDPNTITDDGPGMFSTTASTETSQRQYYHVNAVTTPASSPGPPTTNHTSISTPLTTSPSTPVIHPTILTLHQNHHVATRTNTATRYSLLSIIRCLRSYPLMMTRKETFPPLIHPHLLALSSPSGTGCPTPRDVISKCMSLSHLYALRTPETAAYLWDAILEQSNLFMAHLTSTCSSQSKSSFSSASLIAAIQAQLIYVIMRIVHCSSPKPNSPPSTDPGSRNRELNLNYSIMYVFKKLCETFVDRFGSEDMYFESYTNNHMNNHHIRTHSETENQTHAEITGLEISQKRQDWENWIVAESWRRMKIIFFLIEKIVDVNMGASVKCTSRYADVDWIMLPCGKALWEARSETQWESRLSNHSAATKLVGLGSRGDKLETVGGLLRAHSGAMTGELASHGDNSAMGMSRCAELLDMWNVEADGLGALLNASLGMV
ncbi:hypothetical protein QBC37DRAFT_435393 [Rhypophila decipiens]|uniref:Zn(2)-C6 fungal-type domain-containing protein n=1 Tax=Rhypophila decipiens TaxID=261697 RepID=A0AAN7B2Q1_9PEZI|nr:hypothetical protein QBC37DRAFT_435393 [Rhypophila decipiens]